MLMVRKSNAGSMPNRKWTPKLNIFGSLIMMLVAMSSIMMESSIVHAGTFVQEKNQNITLVLVDTWATLETHSIFFEHIKTMGGGNHTLEFKLISGSPNDPVGIQ